jgi:hypothetical protein
MSVTISSDFILDVLKAAEPSRAARAAARLEMHQPDFASEVRRVATTAVSPDLIADVMAAADPSARSNSEARLAALDPGAPGSPASTGGAQEAYKAFEAMALAQVYSQILPDAESGAFGEGFAGSVWRSMAADQFAKLHADKGGLGIATLASQDETLAAQGSSLAWPYYAVDKITDFTG